MTKTLSLSLLAVFIFQVLISAGFELAHDEAYYWIYSRHLDWGYFDHPPFVGVVIKFFSFLPHSELAVRFGFILLQFATVFMLLSLTGNSLITFLLFFSFPLASIGGFLALPDMPLLFMTASYCYLLKKYLEKDSLKTTLLLGLSIALLFYAKYHGVLLIFFTLVAVPKLFLRKSFYLVAAVALIAFFPHMLWQYQHDFSTLRYHFIERPSSSFSIKRSLEFIGLQIGLAGVLAGPVVWWIIVKLKPQTLFDRCMKLISVGTVFFFLFSSFSKKVEANWTIFLAVPMIYLVSNSVMWQKKWARQLLYASFALVIIVRILFVMPAGLIPVKRLKEFKGWKQWAQDIQYVCGDQGILANSYQVAAKLSYYLNKEVGALNYHSRKNQFDYWRFDKNLPTKEVCYVTDKADFEGILFKTPEGKTIKIVKNQSMESLLKLKYETTR